jgi:PAX-interacting protein 1
MRAGCLQKYRHAGMDQRFRKAGSLGWCAVLLLYRTDEPDERFYRLHDAEMESKFDFKLTKTLALAADSKLLKSCHIYVTANVKPASEVLQKIVHFHGGQFVSSKISLRKLKPSSLQTIVISCDEDKEYWPTLQDQNLRICSTELLLTGVLKQRLDFDRFSLV